MMDIRINDKGGQEDQRLGGTSRQIENLVENIVEGDVEAQVKKGPLRYDIKKNTALIFYILHFEYLTP